MVMLWTTSNQNPSDNRLENLRLATVSENNCNARRSKREHPLAYTTQALVGWGVLKDGYRFMKKHSSYEVICKWVLENHLEQHKAFTPGQVYT